MTLAACANGTGEMLAELDTWRTPVELTDVSFHPQVTDQCGPAALATILDASGIAVTPEELRRRIYIPGRQGSLQIELLAATRHYGRVAYLLDPEVGAILGELAAGRPVLVLQNLGIGLLPVWHYAVVVGYRPDDERFVLRSGDQKRHELTPRAFLQSWKRGDYWAFVALRPGQLPVDAEPGRYLQAVAALESVGDVGEAAVAYRAATSTWPDNGLAWLGLGNALYGAGDLDGARRAYQHGLEIRADDIVTLNNLAQVQAELGCRDDALRTIDAALAKFAGNDSLLAVLRETKAEIGSTPPGSECR